jgi:rhodanese-related sulfurtransferase
MKLKSKWIGIIFAVLAGVVIFILPAQENAKYRPTLATIGQSLKVMNQTIQHDTLLDWVIEGKKDYILIDVRKEDRYEKGHIKGAQNIPLEQFANRATLEDLPEEKRIILYSNKISQSSRAWYTLKQFGLSAYVLEGGYIDWDRAYLNPQVPNADASEEEIQQYKTRLALKNYFAGKGLDGSSEALNLPVNKKRTVRRPKKKKKKLGGC